MICQFEGSSARNRRVPAAALHRLDDFLHKHRGREGISIKEALGQPFGYFEECECRGVPVSSILKLIASPARHLYVLDEQRDFCLECAGTTPLLPARQRERERRRTLDLEQDNIIFREQEDRAAFTHCSSTPSDPRDFAGNTCYQICENDGLSANAECGQRHCRKCDRQRSGCVERIQKSRPVLFYGRCFQ
jgi:hypothetical protein